MGRVIYHRDDGRVAEWLMAPVLKTGVPERVSGVRIPPLPPSISRINNLREIGPSTSVFPGNFARSSIGMELESLLR